MKSVDLVNELLFFVGHLGELLSVAIANILATSTQPQRFLFEVSFLFLIEMSMVRQLVQPPPIPIVFFRALEIPKTQTRLGPPHVILGAMDPAEHHRLIEKLALLVFTVKHSS